MKNRRFAVAVVLVVAGLVGSSGAVAAEPIVPSDMPQARPETPEPWGDPDEDEASDRGWTWFGMGYEKRMRATGAAAERGGNGSGGPPGQHNARRK